MFIVRPAGLATTNPHFSFGVVQSCILPCHMRHATYDMRHTTCDIKKKGKQKQQNLAETCMRRLTLPTAIVHRKLHKATCLARRLPRQIEVPCVLQGVVRTVLDRRCRTDWRMALLCHSLMSAVARALVTAGASTLSLSLPC